jgi:REP element-mobilizing transposase RayT
MPRAARIKSATGIYHIVVRGINKQTIFSDEEDNEKYIMTLADARKASGFKLYGYCLMGNHAHLLLREEKEGLELIFRRIGAGYVYWYNRKYQRTGHLFQDRFKSEPVENNTYLLTALRYIHRNPIKAGICQKLKQYQWSSYNDYLRKRGITDTDFVLSITGETEFVRYTNQDNNDIAIDMDKPIKRLSDAELTKLIQDTYQVQPLLLYKEPTEKKENILREIMKLENVSTRQLARVTSISVNTIWAL